jgi:hypothetical protein
MFPAHIWKTSNQNTYYFVVWTETCIWKSQYHKVIFLTHLKCDFFLYSSITLVFSFMLNKNWRTFQLFWQNMFPAHIWKTSNQNTYYFVVWTETCIWKSQYHKVMWFEKVRVTYLWFSRPAYTCAQYLVSDESSFNICLVGVVFLTHLKCDFFYAPPSRWYFALC